MEPGTFPKLEQPPVVEVVCGVVYEAIPQIDPFLLGLYWKQREPFFKQRLLQPPLLDATDMILGQGIGPVRSWLVSKDEVFVVQVQADRFYLNWRRRKDDYPRFNDPATNKPGLLSRFLDEFKQFSDFVTKEIGASFKIERLQLSKIDHFVESRDWEGMADLAKLLPWLSPFEKFSSTKTPEVTLSFSEDSGNSALRVSMNMLKPGDASRRVLRLDTQIVAPCTSDLATDFRNCNRELNRVFFDLVAQSEMKRFGEKGKDEHAH